MRPIFVYITAKDKLQARDIGRSLVTERLAACANIIDGMNSLYFWEGKLCDDSEAVLLVKSRDTLLGRLTQRVKELHSYSVPCIAALPIIGGNEEYLKWLKTETARRRLPRKKRTATTPPSSRSSPSRAHRGA